MTDLALVHTGSSENEPKKRNKPSLYNVLATRLRNWDPAEDTEELLRLLEMVRESQVPERWRPMMIRAVITAYINFDWMEDEEKYAVAHTIESLKGEELMRSMYASSPRSSRRYILLNHLGYHIKGGI